MINHDAFRGSTTDELLNVDNNFTYQGALKISAQAMNIHLEFSMSRHTFLFQLFCIKTLKGYLEKRRNQVNRKGTMTPRQTNQEKCYDLHLVLFLIIVYSKIII